MISQSDHLLLTWCACAQRFEFARVQPGCARFLGAIISHASQLKTKAFPGMKFWDKFALLQFMSLYLKIRLRKVSSCTDYLMVILPLPSPRGHYFATASHDRTARLWSTDHPQPLRILAGHVSDVNVRFCMLLTSFNRRWGVIVHGWSKANVPPQRTVLFRSGINHLLSVAYSPSTMSPLQKWQKWLPAIALTPFFKKKITFPKLR